MSEEELKQLRLCGLEKQLQELKQKSRFAFHMSFWCILVSSLLVFSGFGLDKLMTDNIIKTSHFLQGISGILKSTIPLLAASVAMLVAAIVERIYFIWHFIWPITQEINDIKKE